jgi:hypothetical protein
LHPLGTVKGGFITQTPGLNSSAHKTHLCWLQASLVKTQKPHSSQPIFLG